MAKGLLISFEGLDGSGKTTQITNFIKKLKINNYDPILFREPGATRIGEILREIVLNKKYSEMTDITELLLYSASRSQLCQEKILPALQTNKIVICDRFFDSTTAYQGFARGIDLEFIKKLNILATGNLVPDITFLLDICMKSRKSRLDSNNLDRLEQEETDFHRKVRSGFLQLVEENTNRFVLIDGTLSVEEIEKLVWKKFQKKKLEK